MGIYPQHEREVWSYERANVDQINRAISLFDWENELSNKGVNEQVELFNETFLNIVKNYIPHKRIKCSYKIRHGLPRKLKQACGKKIDFIRNTLLKDVLTRI